MPQPIHVPTYQLAAPFALGEVAGRNVAVELARVFDTKSPKVYYWAQGGQVCWWAEPGSRRPASKR